MIIDIEGLTVYFPYPYMYPEQYKYMLHIKRTLDQRHDGLSGGPSHCLLEMPTGTGKTVCLLSIITSYQIAIASKNYIPASETLKAAISVPKLVYCTRTVQEMDKVVEELKRVVNYQQKELQERPAILGVCLSSRKNLCIHPRVSTAENKVQVDALCRDLTAPWIRQTVLEKKSAETDMDVDDASPELCEFYEGYEASGLDASITGLYSLDDIKMLGGKRKWCPYFMARHLISIANVVVYNYQYMIDPKISTLVSKEIAKDAIVVFDEAHNIDNICIEALSVTVDRRCLQAASSNIKKLNKVVREAEKQDANRLREEYERLIHGLGLTQGQSNQSDIAQQSNDSTIERVISSVEAQGPPVLQPDVLKEAVPGNIRRAKHFLMFLSTIVQHFKSRLSGRAVEQESPDEFIRRLEQETRLQNFQTRALKFCHDRLQSLMRTLQITNLDEFTPLVTITNFATLVASYSKGFAVILEPFDERAPGIPDPVLELACLDASLAMRPVLERFRTVVITSGTLSPIDLYPKLLNFTPRVIESFAMSVSERQVICPLVVSKGNDQVEVTSRFEKRSDFAVVSNYGRLLIDMASIVPDGIVCFFPSYAYMENILTEWNESGILRQALQHKLIFIETQDIVETSLALDSFKKACDCGRGAIFFSIARGKVAEGIDFDRHYGRCVIIYGVPFQYTLSRVLRARLQFLKDSLGIQESEFLSFDALRQASQCVGRVIRSKLDYGLMIFADIRYKRADKYRKLPKWISQHLDASNLDCSIDRALSISRMFLRKMGQPHSRDDELGVTLLSKDQIIKAISEGKL